LHLSLNESQRVFTPYFAVLFLSLAGPPLLVQRTAAQVATPPGAGTKMLTAVERGDIFMARKMYREAIEVYRDAPPSAAMMNKIGIAYHQLADLNAAQAYYLKATKMNPLFTEAINNLGTIYYSQHSYRRAITLYKKVLRIKPDSASTLANLASAYFGRKQYELAQETLDKALEIDPNVLESRGGAGAVVRDRSVPDRPTFFYIMAKTYAKKGLNEQAISYIRKSLEEGFKEREKFTHEPEFAGLRNDPEFQKVMAVEPKVI
jgi:tetratricopeptide (TPR) repeat protein